MAAEDQRMEFLVVNRDPAIEAPGFFEEKHAQQLERAQRCREIFDQYGLPSPDRVGAEAASDFWVLVQHADGDVELQLDVLAAIESDASGGYDPSESAYLVDRVRVNTGRPQVYGTQMDFDNRTARAFPKPIEAPAKVDERRADAGLESLVSYVNGVCESHFHMNEASYREKGVTKAYVYAEGFLDW